MHELSIAQRLVELALEHMRAAGAKRVVAVTVQIGALSCLQADPLRFGFDLLTQGTPLAGATLNVKVRPVVVYCEPCGQSVALPGIQNFECPICGSPATDIRQGRELDLESIEVMDAEALVPNIASVEEVPHA